MYRRGIVPVSSGWESIRFKAQGFLTGRGIWEQSQTLGP